MQNKYSIKDLENLTGIKAHTLRIWELRYKILKPKRSESNIRFYSNDDLKKILNISFLYNHGYKISKISLLNEHSLNEEIKKLNLTDKSSPIEDLVISMIELDEKSFEQTINFCLLKYGIIETFQNVIFPFLKKIGVLWQTNTINPAQEHFISNLIRQKLISAIDEHSYKSIENQKSILFFLPEGELHELSLLFYCLVAKKNNFKTYYLGQSVSTADLVEVYKVTKPDFITTIITQNIAGKSTSSFLKEIVEKCKNAIVLASGYQLIDSHFNHKRLHIFKTTEDFMTIFKL